MSQTKTGSFVESWINILIGFSINYAANWVLLPLFGFHTLTAVSNFELGCLYTIISFVRSFVIRRWFNGLKFGNSESKVPTLKTPVKASSKHLCEYCGGEGKVDVSLMPKTSHFLTCVHCNGLGVSR